MHTLTKALSLKGTYLKGAKPCIDNVNRTMIICTTVTQYVNKGLKDE